MVKKTGIENLEVYWEYDFEVSDKETLFKYQYLFFNESDGFHYQLEKNPAKEIDLGLFDVVRFLQERERASSPLTVAKLRRKSNRTESCLTSYNFFINQYIFTNMIYDEAFTYQSVSDNLFVGQLPTDSSDTQKLLETVITLLLHIKNEKEIVIAGRTSDAIREVTNGMEGIPVITFPMIASQPGSITDQEAACILAECLDKKQVIG